MKKKEIEKILTEKIEIENGVQVVSVEEIYDLNVVYKKDFFWICLDLEEKILYDVDYKGDCENQNTVEKKCDELRKYICSLGFSQNTD